MGGRGVIFGLLLVKVIDRQQEMLKKTPDAVFGSDETWHWSSPLQVYALKTGILPVVFFKKGKGLDLRQLTTAC